MNLRATASFLNPSTKVEQNNNKSPDKIKSQTRGQKDRAGKSVAQLNEAFSDMHAKMQGFEDAQNEHRKELHAWRTQEDSLESIDDLPDDIFVTRHDVQGPRWWAWCICALVISYVFETYAALVWLGISLSLWHIGIPNHLTVRAKTKFYADEVEDRPSQDRGRTLRSGKTYTLEYYWCVTCRTTEGAEDVSIHNSQWLIFVFYMIYFFDSALYNFVAQYNLYPKFLASSLSPQHSSYDDIVSTSLIAELQSRKTMFSTQPQFTTLAQRMDMLPVNKLIAIRSGISVGNCTIKYLRLMQSGQTVQPFAHLRNASQFNMGTESTTVGFQLPTHLLNLVSTSATNLTAIPSWILVGLRWLVEAVLLLLVIACTALILGTLFQYWPGAQSDLHSHPLQPDLSWPEGCVGDCGDFASASSDSSFSEDFSHNSPIHQPSESGSTNHHTPEHEENNSLMSSTNVRWIMVRVVSVPIVSAFVMFAKSVGMMIVWGFLVAYHMLPLQLRMIPLRDPILDCPPGLRPFYQSGAAAILIWAMCFMISGLMLGVCYLLE